MPYLETSWLIPLAWHLFWVDYIWVALQLHALLLPFPGYNPEAWAVWTCGCSQPFPRRQALIHANTCFKISQEWGENVVLLLLSGHRRKTICCASPASFLLMSPQPCNSILSFVTEVKMAPKLQLFCLLPSFSSFYFTLSLAVLPPLSESFKIFRG